MNQDVQTYIELCQWDPARFLIFSDNVFGVLVYYSHLLPLVVSLLFALFVFFRNPKLPESRLLLITMILLGVWLFSDLVLWATEKPPFTMFFWSILILVEPMIYAGILLLTYALLNQEISFAKKLLIFGLLLPTILFAPTSLALTEYDLSNCWREALEGPLALYGYAIEILFTLWILLLGLRKVFVTKDMHERIKAGLITAGAVFFLLSFATGNIIGSLLVDWEIGQYGLFGIPVFVAMLSYLTVRYNTFNFSIKLISAQVIVVSLWLLTFSILFVRSIETTRIIVSVTLVLFAAMGYMLVRGVSNEVNQKKVAQKLATELAGANMRLERLDKMKSEFVSIASHQLRSPLTSVRGYISMIMEGSYGEVPPKVKEVLTHVADASRHMALSIEDYLNVSRIEAGNMKYEIVDYDLKKLAEEVYVEMLPVAEKKGIKLEFKPEVTDAAVVKLDIGKTRQIVQNLIDNALKYTKDTGSIIVTVRKDATAKQAFVDVTDHGIGISPENLKSLFQKFERAKNANEINVTGTGLGLYIARTMARGMGGDISAASPGEGQGSTFTVSFPLNGIESKWGSAK